MANSKRKNRQGLSALLILTMACLVALGAVAARHKDAAKATDLIVWAFLPLSVLLVFAWPTRITAGKSDGRRRRPWRVRLLGWSGRHSRDRPAACLDLRRPLDSAGCHLQESHTAVCADELPAYCGTLPATGEAG